MEVLINQEIDHQGLCKFALSMGEHRRWRVHGKGANAAKWKSENLLNARKKMLLPPSVELVTRVGSKVFDDGRMFVWASGVSRVGRYELVER